jgi:hypothetical protein
VDIGGVVLLLLEQAILHLDPAAAVDKMGCIQVGSGIADEFKNVSRYNRNIRIENNLFRHFSNLPLLFMYSVDGLTFTNNRLERTTAYPAPDGREGKLFMITDSDHVKVDEPKAASTSEPTTSSN